MQAELNNLKIAIRLIESHQKTTKSESVWQSYEVELLSLRKRLGELECQMDKT